MYIWRDVQRPVECKRGPGESAKACLLMFNGYPSRTDVGQQPQHVMETTSTIFGMTQFPLEQVEYEIIVLYIISKIFAELR